MSLADAELWAQAGVDHLCEPYRRLDPPLIDLREAAAMIRASYAAGYSRAFTDPDPDVVVASGRSETLRLMLPV